MPPLTDLEALVQHLAGRLDPAAWTGHGPADAVVHALEDPTSDASRFLDQIRRKTRSLLDDGNRDDPEAGPGLSPARSSRSGASMLPDGGRRRNLALLVGFAIGSLIGAGIGGAIARDPDRGEGRRLAESNGQLLAAIRDRLTAREARAAPPAPDFGTIEAAVGRLADRLDRLDQGMVALARPLDGTNPAGTKDEPPPATRPGPVIPDANLTALEADLATIRREVTASEAATARQIQEMRTILQEVNTVVRRVLGRTQADTVANITRPLLAVAVQALTNNLQHPSPQVRGEAVEQLIRIGAPARSALPALQQRLNQESDLNIRNAIQAALTVLSRD